MKDNSRYAQNRCQKSHDLVLLSEMCYRYDRSFEQIRPIVDSLNPFGTLTRYPSDRPDPDEEITRNTLSKAEDVLLFIKNKILDVE